MQKIILFLLLSLFVVSINAQTPTPSPASASSTDVGIKDRLAGGEVKLISQAGNKIQLSTKDGAIDVILSTSTVYKRVPPENPSITAAVASNLSEIGEGDKILVTGTVAADKKSIPAKTVYLMTKSDINKRNQAEKELWRTRGISGKVVSVDFKTQNVTIATPARGMAPGTNVILSPKEKVEYLRYSPDSVKYSDAVGSSLAEIRVGDELRALGDKSTDGLTFKTEKYLTGSFRQVAGKVTAIDLVKNEITIEDSANKKPIFIVIKNTTSLKKFPEEQAKMMAMMMGGGGAMQGGQAGTFTMTRPQGDQPKGQTPPQGNNPSGQKTPTVNPQTPGNGQPTPTVIVGNGNGQMGGGNRQMGRGGGDINEMIDKLPNLTIADLKIGDTIGISTTPGNVPNRYTAIKLISGIEAFLSIPQRTIAGGQGNQPTINIPGLDGGIGNP